MTEGWVVIFRFWIAIGLILAGWSLGGVVAAATAIPQETGVQDRGRQNADAVQREPAPQKPFSPLHEFLGIDPQTGAFVDSDAAAKRRAEQRSNGADASDAAGSFPAGAPPAADPTTSGSRAPVIDDASRDAEAAREAVRRITERINEGSLDNFSSVLDGQLGGESLGGITRQLAWLTAGLLSLYPLSILLAELFGGWFRRDREGLTDLDRQYQRTRLRRRIMLAACWIALIVLGTFASLSGYWWSEPPLFTLFCIAVGLLGIAIATLTSMVNQAAKDYAATLMRQMRREQLEMRADLDEVCKRMRQVTMTRD